MDAPPEQLTLDLDGWEGPLDLLLSLARAQKVDLREISILALTMVILGGLGNISGALLGAVALVSLPELFRVTAEYRMLIYGVALLLLIRFRPQGLLGTV